MKIAPAPRLALPTATWALGTRAAALTDDIVRLIMLEYRAHLHKRMACHTAQPCVAHCTKLA